MNREMSHVARLVRARLLLAATLGDHRAIVGKVSRSWIHSEIEQTVRWGSLPEPLKRHPAVQVEADDARINTNRLPKLEPWINANVLVGAMLYGTRLYGADMRNPVRGGSNIENDLIIAAMIHETLGQHDQYSALLPSEWCRVDDSYLRAAFGSRVLEHVHAILDHRRQFDRALESGSTDRLTFAPAYADVIAAVEAARLRLTARAAGDGIFRLLDEQKRAELRERGIDCGSPGDEFPERPHLERDHQRALAAVHLAGVDELTLRTPIEGQLLLSTGNVLQRGLPPEQLVGRFGAAVFQFHGVLPLLYRYSPTNRKTARDENGETIEIEGPFALATLHASGLEAARYLQQVRRKANGSAVAHSFVVASRAQQLATSQRGIPIIAASDCHDVVEDGSLAVTGYDQTLEMFASRFGAPLAALVAEVTDSTTKADGPAKAAAFMGQAMLPTAGELYDVGQFDELQAVATDPKVPYTVAGVVIKLADTGTTKDEGIRDPDMMSGVWRHSGARINWDLYRRGRIIGPLLERLVTEIRVSKADPFYHSKPGALSSLVVVRLTKLIEWFLCVSDQYMVQNLTILADEYALSTKERDELTASFFDTERSREAMQAYLEKTLVDSRLDEEVRLRGLPASYRVRGGKARRELTQLLEYRDSALLRAEIRRTLDIPPPERKLLDDVRQLYELRMGAGSRA